MLWGTQAGSSGVLVYMYCMYLLDDLSPFSRTSSFFTYCCGVLLAAAARNIPWQKHWQWRIVPRPRV